MFTEQLLDVAMLVGAFAFIVRMVRKTNRNSLEIEIMRRQRDLDKPVFDDEILEIGEAVFYAHINRVKEVVSGLVPPTHCGECDYCKTIKHLEYPALTLAQYIEGESKRKLDKIARF